jgi:APA family basic amino acid/polyamine antiporter
VGVRDAAAIVRARRTGQAIVNEAKRRGVEAIVLAAEEPSRVRSGAMFGGGSGPLDNYVGEITKYVIRKAPCRVILTAPPAGWQKKFERDHGATLPARADSPSADGDTPSPEQVRQGG